MLSRRTLLGAGFACCLGVGGVMNAAEEASAHDPWGFHALPTSRRVVALSFDDGPDPQNTPLVLDLLAAHGARASFFVIGAAVTRYPEVVRRTAHQGHEVANHTATHARLDRLDRPGVRGELEGGAAAIDALRLPTGASPLLVRPPYGFEGPASRAELQEGPWTTARWHACVEHLCAKGPVAPAARRMADQARPGDVLLAHDGGPFDRSRTIEALPTLLGRLVERGFEIATVGALLRG